MTESKTLQYALSLAKRGLYIFPIQPGSKVPYSKAVMGGGWKAYSSVDRKQINQWAKELPGCNWAVDCGKSGLVVLDVDVKNGKAGGYALRQLEKQYGKLPNTLTIKTPSGGFHYYFKGLCSSGTDKLGSGLDIKSVGGYVLAPGGVIGGKMYEPITKFELASVPGWVVSMAGAPLEKEQKIQEPACELDQDHNVDIAANYLKNAAPLAETGSRDNTCYLVACKLRDLGISAEKSKELMLEYYTDKVDFSDDFSHDDMLKKVESAWNSGQNQPGSKTPDALFGSASHINPGLQGLSAKELMSKKIPEQRWAVPGLIPEGLGILAGKPKLGKSFLALQLCLAKAEGAVFLDNETLKGAAAYIALEDGPRRLQERLKRMLQGRPAPDGLIFFTEWKPLDQGGLIDLEKFLKDNPDTELAIFDTWQKVRPISKPKGASAYEIDYSEASKIKMIADKYHCAVLLVHHLRKSAPGAAGDVFERVNGSTGITGAADVLLILDRHRNVGDAELHVSGRDIEEGQHLLARNKESLGWDRIGGAEINTRTPEQQRIIKTIKSLESASPKDIADQSGLDPQYIKNTLPKLMRQGFLAKVAHGKYQVVEIFGDC